LSQDYSIRRLSSDQFELLRELLAVFADVFEEPETYLGSVPNEAYLRTLLAERHFICLVAVAGDEVIGGLVAYELAKFEQERSEIYLYDLGVRKGHRRKGVATGLIYELKRIARARGAWVIFVQADRGDSAAIKLYESLGAKEPVYHFDIPV